MRLAGIDIPDNVVLELAVLLRRGGFIDTAETLEGAIAANQPDMARGVDEQTWWEPRAMNPSKPSRHPRTATAGRLCPSSTSTSAG